MRLRRHRFPATLLVGCLGAGCQSGASAPTSLADTPPPVARLSITIAESKTATAIWGVTPIRFDASSSSGADLTYSLEFGDGTTSSDRIATRVAMPPVRSSTAFEHTNLFATLTVTDRFGRKSDVRELYEVVRLGGWPPLWLSTDYEVSHEWNGRLFHLFQRGTTDIVGTYWGPETGNQNVAVTGKLSSPNHIRLVLDDGSVGFEGDLHLHDELMRTTSHSWGMMIRLTVYGGPASGRTLDFFDYDPY